NQPYVDPAYAALNPAYVQPTNSRPVWGLAKPLPRVLRPGMVPAPSEMNVPQMQPGDRPEFSTSQPDNIDLELGKPSLRRAGTFQAAANLRDQRENQLLRRITLASSNARTSMDEQPRPSTNIAPTTSATTEPFPGLALPTPIPEREEPEEDGGDYFDRTQSNVYSFGPSAQGGVKFDDGHSDTTEVEHDQDAWPPLTNYDLKMGNPEDEIHNHHTHWSIIRTRYREPLAEFLAVIVQLTIGFCADLSITVSKNPNDFSGSFAWGFASMSGIYIAGGISGAHLNPAISIMLYIYRGFPLRKIPSYVFAQILAAFVAALISYGLYRTAILEYAGGLSLGDSGTASAFITSRRHSTVDASTAFFNEFVATGFLAIVVLALGDDSNAPPGAGMSALVLGLVITVLCMAFGYNTGAAMNPSRDLGPRLALLALGYGGDLFRNGFWVYGCWVATILGAIVGAGFYDIAIFVGGESPINYPKKRIWRAGHKFKKRVAFRLKREE
ncbi:aquaporin-like protein, partial [Delphinella strobiligena]